MGLIADRVAAARAGDLPQLVGRMPSGWAVLGDAQVLPGYCLLLADPVVPSLNDLAPADRATYLTDLARLGDAVIAATGAERVNYGILGNVEPELHGHVFPRFADEDPDLRLKPVWLHDWDAAPPFSPDLHGPLREKLRAALAATDGTAAAVA